MMILIIFSILLIVGCAGYVIRPLLPVLRQEKKELVAGLDTDGLPLKYEPHYARSIEIEQGLNGKLTQCDNFDCQTCYWKAGKEQRAEMLPFDSLKKKFYEWNDELLDGLSDELYESMFEDWLASPSVASSVKMYNAQLEKRRQSDEYLEHRYGRYDDDWDREKRRLNHQINMARAQRTHRQSKTGGIMDGETVNDFRKAMGYADPDKNWDW